MPKFEVAIYNRKVRDLMKEGESHRHLDDSWADMHYIEVRASSEEAAREKIESRHAPHEGYVIDQIVTIED